MELQVGTTVGDYRVIGVLGSGGAGKVFKVQNVITDRFEAMKALLPNSATEPKLVERFMREIKVHARLEHPNIASFRTALRVGNQLLMVMELVEGVTLLDKVQSGPLPPATALEYITQVLSALECAHGHGVIHRDVKLSNMMLTPAGVVKLLDFGIAKGANDFGLTMSGTTLGSPFYIAPEQIQGAATVDGRADLYSVGISLYELVTGKKPFDGDNRFAILAAHLKQMPAPPMQVNPRLPKTLSDLILTAVAKSPDARFQTAAEFRQALRGLAEAIPATTEAGAVPVRAMGARWAGGWRGVGVGLGAVTVAAAAMVVTQLGLWRGTKAAPLVPKAQPVATAPPAAVPRLETPVPAVTSAPDAPAPAAAEIAANPAPVPAPAPEKVPAPVPSSPAAGTRPGAADAPPPIVSSAQLQEIRKQLVLLDLRTSAIHASLQTLERTQAAAGLYLSSDMVEAEGLMDSYLEGANAALSAGDAVSAKSFADKAQRQAERLEKFLKQ